MPYVEVSAFLTRLRASGGVWGRLALEFVILTAASPNRVPGPDKMSEIGTYLIRRDRNPESSGNLLAHNFCRIA